MSEYQYYEFRAIDRPLDEKAMRKLRAITSRAEITPTSLVNEYHWGDFKGDPLRLVEQYFDAFLYFANWGTHWFMLRFPRGTFDLAAAKRYATSDIIDIHTTKTHVILEFHSEEEDGGWEEEGDEGWLGSLISLRQDLMAGDYRCLYLAWLSGVGAGVVDDDETEPPVPRGLGRLTGSLEALADFMRVDPNLLAVAAEGATGEAPAPATADELAAWLATVPAEAKDDYLLRVMQGQGVHLGGELTRRYWEDRSRRQKRSPKAVPTALRRTAAALLTARDRMAEEKQRRAAAERAKKQEQEARKRAEGRRLHLESLVGREKALWRQVETAVATKQPKQYDVAAQLLKDLHDLAERTGDQEAFAAALQEFRVRHAAKRTFIQRLDRVGLPVK
jgi:hypothetical protein